MNKNKIEKYNNKTTVYGKFINEYLFPYIPPNCTLLDVGCSTGLLGERLIKEKGCKVYGVDISELAIREAKKRLTMAEYMDVEEDELPFDVKFDVILFADILEHLLFPEQVLNKFKKYLKKEGIYIISLPNVANIRIRLKLLMGKWDYQKSGILDEGHLHFYTYNSAKVMFHKNGFYIQKVSSTPGFIINYSKIVGLKKLIDKANYFFPKLFSNQFIFIVRELHST